jgi:hypothetical protein
MRVSFVVCMMLSQALRHGAYRHFVAEGPEAADDPGGSERHQGCSIELVTPVDVGHVDLRDGLIQRLQRIQQRDGAEREAGRVDDHGSGALAGLLDPIDQHTFVIGLTEFARQSQLIRDPPAQLLHLLERGTAVQVRFTHAQQVEVGSVEDVDGAAHGWIFRGSRQALSNLESCFTIQE